MRAIVVYESVWGKTATVARAIAQGFGSDAEVHPTDEVPRDRLEADDLIIAGSPVFGFSLPTESMRERILSSETAVMVTTTAMKLCGAAALQRGVLPLERYFRDAITAQVMGVSEDAAKVGYGKYSLGIE